MLICLFAREDSFLTPIKTLDHNSSYEYVLESKDQI